MDWKQMFGLGKKDERELTEAEAAILVEAKPETEAKALAALGEVRQCHNCKHRPETVCHLNQTVMKPNESCSCWE